MSPRFRAAPLSEGGGLGRGGAHRQLQVAALSTTMSSVVSADATVLGSLILYVNFNY